MRTWNPPPTTFLALRRHGFMHAPAVGEVVAALIGGEDPPVDVSALDPARFQNELQPEAYVF